MPEKVSSLAAKRLEKSSDIGELILLRTYQGDAGQLERSITELKMLSEFIQTEAVTTFKDRLLEHLNDYGYLTPAELERAYELQLEAITMSYDPREVGGTDTAA